MKELPPVPDFENDPTLTEKQKSRRRDYYKNRQRYIEEADKWRIANPEKVAASKNRNKPNREKLISHNLSVSHMRYGEAKHDFPNELWRTAKYKDVQKEHRVRLKRAAIDTYGGVCACCGESDLEFLTIDHINNDGNKWRRNGWSGGIKFYRQLKNAGYPKGELQVLCFNCNCAKAFYGYCPHESQALLLLGMTPKLTLVKREKLTKSNPTDIPIVRRSNLRIPVISDDLAKTVLDRVLRKEGSISALAREYGVSIPTMHRAVHRISDIRETGT